MTPDFSPLLELDVSQKLRLVEALWDSIAAHPEQLPVPQWQKDELARRKEAHLRDPGAAVSWEEALKQIRGGNG
jgi:putative addiction module component (TIGR02574 family)